MQGGGLCFFFGVFFSGGPVPSSEVSNNEEAMRILLESGATVEKKTEEQGTALTAAARNCQLDAMKFLLSNNRSNASASGASGECKDSPLFVTVTQYAKEAAPCQSDPQQNAGPPPEHKGGKLRSMVQVLQRHGASLSQACAGQSA